VANETYDYGASVSTLTLYARRQSMPEAGSTSTLRRSYRSMRGVLDRLHVDSSKFNDNVPNELKEEEKEKRKSKENEKKRERNHQGGQYRDHNRYYHEKESFLNKAAKSTKLGTAVPKSSISLEPTKTALRHQRSTSMAGSTNVSLPSRKSANRVLTYHQHQQPYSYEPRQHLVTHQPILVPVAQATAKKARVADRIADSRLKGADLYVARLAWKHAQHARVEIHDKSQKGKGAFSASSLNSSLSDLSIKVSRPSPTGSLYDELSRCSTTISQTDPEPVRRSNEIECATSSRPCYRCISYMQWAGIRRVFWTNDEGQWEGAKVRDLVDALELGTTTGTSGMFVTKHEVLMLRGQIRK
jgi:hypothetical protein